MILQLSSFFFKVPIEDKKNIKNICVAFQNNGRMRALIGKGKADFSKGLQVVISFCYFMVKKLDGVFISKDQTTFLLYYRKSEHYFALRDWMHYLYLAFFVVGISRLKMVLKREKLIRKTRLLQIQKNQDVDFFYVWFLAQKRECKSITGLVESKEHILQKAKEMGLPIYIETTERRLLAMYRRMGFEFYDYREDESADLKVWFGRLGK